MKIKDIYKKGTLPLSFEIFPPKGELDPGELRRVLAGLTDERPSFISVTCSAGGTGGNAGKTAHLASIIQDEYSVTAAAHVTCINSKRAEIDETLRSVQAAGLENILALRGDRVPGCEPGDFAYGAELIRYIRQSPEFASLCVGAGCYPEGHVDCESPEKDIDRLFEKQEAGADFLISQLFFDNEAFYRFIDKIRSRGVTLPVDAGIMPIMSKSQITRMVFLCGASLPAAVVRLLAKYESDPGSLLAAALDYARGQIADLKRSGACQGIHLYTMNRPDVAHALAQAL